MRFKNDNYDKFGIFILTDEKKIVTAAPEYLDVADCKLFSFPYNEVSNSRVALSTIKQGQVFTLISSDDTDALTPDSYFRTMRANKIHFKNSKEEFAMV